MFGAPNEQPIHVPNRHSRRKNKAIDRGAGRSDVLDAYNDRLAEDGSDDRIVTLHPTKGYRSLSLKRVEAAELTANQVPHYWSRMARKIAS